MTIRTDRVDEAARCLDDGGVVAYPAEACFGLGCHPDNLAALARIRQLKDRSERQGFILVSDELERLLPWLDWSALTAQQQRQIENSWPGPITWLVPASARSGAALRGEYDSLAVRVTAFSTLRELCAVAAMPLVSTSANRGGEAPLVNADQVAEVFGDELDCILDQPIQGLEKPSQIIDATTQKTIRTA